MTYKVVTMEGNCPEHGEWEAHYVVPESVSVRDLLFGQEGDPVFGEVFCECFDRDNADLVVSLLNKEARH